MKKTEKVRYMPPVTLEIGAEAKDSAPVQNQIVNPDLRNGPEPEEPVRRETLEPTRDTRTSRPEKEKRSSNDATAPPTIRPHPTDLRTPVFPPGPWILPYQPHPGAGLSAFEALHKLGRESVFGRKLHLAGQDHHSHHHPVSPFLPYPTALHPLSMRLENGECANILELLAQIFDVTIQRFACFRQLFAGTRCACTSHFVYFNKRWS